uniref:Uncharacterized protein n=1 Tax=Glossina pallidipes TaxID=7398 RepID=A0A1B0AE44_GLOPL
MEGALTYNGNIFHEEEEKRKIVKSGNEDINTNDNITIFGYKSKTFVDTIEKCPLEIKDIKYQKTNFAHIRAYCCRNSKKDKVCLEYDIFMVKRPASGQPLQCFFTTRGVFNHTFFKASQVRGYKRTIFREEMKNILPKQARVNFLNKLDNKDLEAYNLGEVKSEGVYKKIRSEIIRDNDLSSDDLEDLRKRYAKNATEDDQFFQYLAEPCEVGLFSRNQVKVAAIAKKVNEGGLVCHLDATGSIIRNISDVRNYIFYYALVITNHRGKNYPVAERIASTHDAGSIDEMCKEATAIEIFRKKKRATDKAVTFSTVQDSPQDCERDMQALVDAVYDDNKGVSTYKDSLFYNDCYKIFEEVNNSLSADFNVSNPFYSPDFAEYFLKHYAPYLPMWSSIISDGQSNSFIPTNGVVEGWFHEVKHNIISKVEYGVGRIKFGRFIDALRLNITSETKQVFFNIPPSNLNISKRGIAHKSIDQDNIDVSSSGFVETWGKKELLSPRTSNFLNLKRNGFTSPLATPRSSKSGKSFNTNFSCFEFSPNSSNSSLKSAMSNKNSKAAPVLLSPIPEE